ncbi:progestin and adipoQ receptor family member 3 isoform X1 [Rhineura floridana]|uniref:progestin and adipoQ receptor family member 3 isoform X1 n=1 Tax=Rhineura floridana TaxID=261503 RepID=UPI002AC84CC0|nr:progestin and adipoQ receptor family member 3 isoform X1 [Rhineura floridana]
MDLKAAFESVSRTKLWSKLSCSMIDKRLLFLIKHLYQCTTFRVCCGANGSLTSSILASKGVRQGCVLAHTLFNLFLNDLKHCCSSPNFHSPKLAGFDCPLLLYADDAVLMSLSNIALKRLLSTFMNYCSENLITINFNKSKILVFSVHPWKIKGQTIEQVKQFRYLGVLFQSTLSWFSHTCSAIQSALNSVKAIIRFFFTKGGQYVPAAIQVFKLKIPNFSMGSHYGPRASTPRLNLFFLLSSEQSLACLTVHLLQASVWRLGFPQLNAPLGYWPLDSGLKWPMPILTWATYIYYGKTHILAHGQRVSRTN